MSDETKRPFEVGEWVTNGKVCGVVHYDETLPAGFMVRSEYDWNPDDWSRWAAFDPGDIKEINYLRGCMIGSELDAYERAKKAEARVEELEENLAVASRGDALTYVETLEDRAARAEARVAELEAEVEKARVVAMPPEGHVAVHLPRKIADCFSDLGWIGGKFKPLAAACRKALEVTCSVCNDTVPSGHPCSCDDGRS